MTICGSKSALIGQLLPINIKDFKTSSTPQTAAVRSIIIDVSCGRASNQQSGFLSVGGLTRWI